MNRINVCNSLAYVILCFLIVSVVPFVVPKVFGYEPYGILSNSMLPTYDIGSLVYVKKCQPSSVEKGDVITFKQSVTSDNVATHRVMEIDSDLNAFITKGDHNPNVDATPVVFDRLIGKVVLGIPLLGSFYLWLVSIVGVFVCSFSLLMVILLWWLVHKWKKESI